MQVGFFGAGKMAEGIVNSITYPEGVIMAERNPERAEEMRARYGVKVTDDLREVARVADLIFLAVRPADVAAVAEAVRDLLTEEQVLVSIVAGRTLASLAAAFGPKVRMVRVMPNLGLRARAGMCVVTSDRRSAKDAEMVQIILNSGGETLNLPEEAFDAVTALSGSGPAYFAYMAQAMVEGGMRLGLSYETAWKLSLQTMYGTAKFLRESEMEVGPFIQAVCTPGGTTAAGMAHLDVPPFRQMVADTLAAAARRSKELLG